jgi:dolichol-phosphate mannosyltransferase
MAAGKIAVVVPTYNERENIGALLDCLGEVLSSLSGQAHFLVVDDMSNDGTAAIVLERQRRNPEIHLLSGRRTGLGTAYVRGMGYVLERFDPDVVIQMDADFSHSPRDIPRLLDAVAAGADLAIGSRYSDGDRTPDDWGWRRRWLSRGGNLLVRYWLELQPVMDCTAGFRAWRADTLRDIDLDTILTHGYVFQVDMLHRAIERGARVMEVPVVFRDRTCGISKLGWTDMIEFARWTFASTPLFWRKR